MGRPLPRSAAQLQQQPFRRDEVRRAKTEAPDCKRGLPLSGC